MGRPPLAKLVFPLLAMALPGGCGPRAVSLEPSGLEAPVAKAGWSDWGRVLSRVHTASGVDYSRLAADPAPLNRFLQHLADWGPRTAPADFPDRDARLAYLINAQNAAALRGVLEHGGPAPGRLPGDLATRYRFTIDGRPTTAAELRSEARQLAGDDWRVRLALCEGRAAGPPLPPRPFLADLLDAQLNEATRLALASDGVVRIDHGESKRLLVWSGLYELRERLTADDEARRHARGATLLSVLLEWSDRPRREWLNTAIGYRVAPLPDDGLANAARPPPPPRGHGLWSALRAIQATRFNRPEPSASPR